MAETGRGAGQHVKHALTCRTHCKTRQERQAAKASICAARASNSERERQGEREMEHVAIVSRLQLHLKAHNMPAAGGGVRGAQGNGSCSPELMRSQECRQMQEINCT